MAPKISRPEPLRRLDRDLTALSKRIPEAKEFFELLFSLADPDHKPAALDRTAAITASAFIEYALRKAITTHLKQGIDERELNQLFESAQGPLTSLNAKIMLAYALGIILEDERDDLNTIRTIRNTFAHSMTHINFRDQEVAKLCLTLHIAKQFGELAKIPDMAKNIFVSCAASRFFNLITYYPNVERDIFASAFLEP